MWAEAGLKEVPRSQNGKPKKKGQGKRRNGRLVCLKQIGDDAHLSTPTPSPVRLKA
jgi:hypothetical protein